jgi:RNA polymerase sigma-70 factor (ECF subfamily)
MNQGTHPDLALARRAAGGDEGAWREIYTATRERMFALLCYHIGNRDEALDVLQDVYVGAVRGIGNYRGDASLEAWLAGIALRRARDWKRRLLGRFKRTDTLEGELPPETQGLPQPDPEQGRRLRQALAQLPERQRSAVLLHVWMGYPFREVGEALGVSEATARVHAFRGREALRGMLESPDAAPLPTRFEVQRS